ncbi:MAG: hypothetical protein HY866_06465 [Chloroflexi bacterium]|nr:hypothetical protein [Chloroflexota bacterium]
MEKYGQISITIGTLGIVIALMGVFPGIVGLEATEGIGVLQVLVMLAGFSILFSSAYVFVKQTFYPGLPTTLSQDIGLRLTLTGLLIAAAAGLADVLGFGSHPSTAASRPLLGRLQVMGFIGSLLLASAGVMIFALFGPHPSKEESPKGETIPPNGENG